jgi:hypothetical protein
MARCKIYNHDIMHCTSDGVVGNYLFCGRVLGSTEPEDIVQLRPELKSEWNAIAEHYRRIELSHSENVIWDVSFKVLMEHPEYDVSVFFFGDAMHQAESDENWLRQLDNDWLDVVQYINSKNNFIQLAEELGVDVPKTQLFTSKTSVEDTSEFIYPCYLKLAISVDGDGVICCKNERELQAALNSVSATMPLQIQESIAASTFLNLQYRVTENGAQRLAATEQILDGFSHSGNRYPTQHQPWGLVDAMAQWMAEKGMKEIFAFDVGVIEEPVGTRYTAIECNPRFNGASYPTGIAQKLDIPVWNAETFNTQHRALKDIDLSGIEYDPASGKGVILVNWGCILVGRIGVLFAGTPEEQLRLKATLKQRL